MKIKKTIKKIVALGAGASMVGATMLSAIAAADLSTYPDPFVKDGKFNALIVVGESAATQDVLGAIDIATSLQFASKTTQTVSTGTASTTTGTGDVKKIEQSTNKLEMNESISSIATSVTSADLDALADGRITNEYGDFDYTQTIYLPDGGSRIIFGADPDDSDSVAKPYFYIPSGASVYRYKMSFTPALKSDHTTSGNQLEDIKNKKIKIMGKEYTILKAAHPATNQTALTLMAGAVTDVLEEGQSKTYTIRGTDYDVTLDFVGTADAKFTVNGETTNSLAEGDTYKLADGSELGVVDVLAQEFAGGLRKVEFNLGASKIKIEDTNTMVQNWGGVITVGSEDLSQVKADIVTSTDDGTAHGCDVKITSIELNYTAGDDLYLDVGSSAADVAATKEGQTGNFLNKAFDYKFQGLQIGKTEEIELVPTGSNNYKIKFTSKSGISYNQEFVARNGTNQFHLGRYSGSTMYDVVTNESGIVTKNEYFVLSKNKYSHIMQFKNVRPGTSTSDNQGTLVVKDVGDGTLHEITYTNLYGTLNLDGNTYRINVSGDTTSSTPNGIDLDGDGSIGANVVNPEFWTQYEANITFVASPSGGVENLMYITSEEDEDNVKDVISIGFTESGDNKIDIEDNLNSSSGSYASTSLVQSEDGSYLYKWITNYGMQIELDRIGSGNTQNKLKVIYPDEQVFGAFFVEGNPEGTDYSTSTGEGVVETTTINKIEVGAAVLDTDPAVDGRETQQNLIVVGGPAINKAAAVLLGKPFPSYGADSGIPENAAIIKLVQNGDNVAMIVAGWSAQDSQRAARVVADYETYQQAGTLTGTEVEVTGTSLTDITVGAPRVQTETTTTTGTEGEAEAAAEAEAEGE
jgi:hypothetical protein